MRNSDEEQRVNSTTGFVENIDNPTDLYYKRDSIMHAQKPRRLPGLSACCFISISYRNLCYMMNDFIRKENAFGNTQHLQHT